MKKKSIFSIILFLALIILLFGCSKETSTEAPPDEPKPQSYAAGGVFKEFWDFNESDGVGVAVFGPMIPWVTINNDTLPLDIYESGTYWDTTMSLTCGSTYNLKVDFLDYGSLTGSCKLPGTFTLTPSGTYTLPVDSSFNGSWTASDGADWYWVDFYLSYEDTNWNSYHFDTTFIAITTTSFSLSASQLFPDSMGPIEWSSGYFRVAAVNGPIPQPGSYGNITGDGYGFFLGGYFSEETDIQVQGSTYKEEGRDKTGSEKFFEMLKKLIPGAGLFSESK